MERYASAQWNGLLRDGQGTLTTDSRVLSQVPYSFSTRFENEPGTNPEELIAAAHAGCFSMALAGELQKMQLRSETIQTRATVKLEKGSEGFSVTAIHLKVSAAVPGATDEQFLKAAEAAKAGCPISRLLKAQITMEAVLELVEETPSPDGIGFTS